MDTLNNNAIETRAAKIQPEEAGAIAAHEAERLTRLALAMIEDGVWPTGDAASLLRAAAELL